MRRNLSEQGRLPDRLLDAIEATRGGSKLSPPRSRQRFQILDYSRLPLPPDG